MAATKSLPGLYVALLAAGRRRADRSTRFDPWQAGPCRVTLDHARYRAYAARIGLRDDRHLLPSWFYVLAQRAVLHALADRRFPYSSIGTVHLSNSTRIEEMPGWGSELILVLDIGYGELTSAGHRIDLVARFHSGDRLVATNSMSIMVLCPAADRGPKPTPPAPEALANTLALEYPANTGRQYARVCDDYNPIHLWPWSARLFGFRRPIAHGMFSTGRIAALLTEQGLPTGRRIDTTFLKPVFLPSRATLGYEADGLTTRFELTGQDERVLLRGTAC